MCVCVYVWVQTQTTMYDLVVEMNARQQVLERRTDSIEDGLSRLQVRCMASGRTTGDEWCMAAQLVPGHVSGSTALTGSGLVGSLVCRFLPRDAILAVCSSVCPSATGWRRTKIAKISIMQTTLYYSTGTLVSWCQRWWWNSNEVTSPQQGGQIQVG